MSTTEERSGLQLLINGVVQGVGFRPFVYRLAQTHHLTGWVQNSSAGVMIEIHGLPGELNAFTESLRTELPPLARIESLASLSIPAKDYPGFEIKPSAKRPGAFSLLPTDVAICDDCRKELFDPKNHRYHYPFINCTNCGPRFSIIQDMPYDRPATTMSGFELCPTCKAEYDDPLDRRFHAQPIACPKCGPQLSFIQNGRLLGEKNDALQLARYHIKNGKILAIKGLGGFLLVCNALNEDAVKELRHRKHRSDKPLALMAFDLDTIKKYCLVSEPEAQLLASRQMPIVVLQGNRSHNLTDTISPAQTTLGVMLPYTPLHLLLCEPQKGYPELLVMTSANISEEPIIYKDEEMHKLDALTDAYLTHNRPIHIRMDDSVARFSQNKPLFLRRSRGYAPEPIPLPFPMSSVLACGALLKNTFTFTNNRSAFMSPFIGDLENLETNASFEHAIEHFKQVYKFQPEAYVCDLHPDFISTQFAQDQASRMKKPLIKVQHHHAHLAACLAENGWNKDTKVIGLSFDGTGLGTDHAIWGGEFLIGNYRQYSRAYILEYMPLPGGDTAIRNPGKIALAYLHALDVVWNQNLPPVKGMPLAEQEILLKQLKMNINTIQTSSMGRLFDAVAALAGVKQQVSYEGQAAIELEALADPTVKDAYTIEITGNIIKFESLFHGIIKDVLSAKNVSIISAKFHNAIINLVVDICQTIKKKYGITEVALSGGVWQNMILFQNIVSLLESDGFTVYTHKLLPPNDGCISYGQAVIAGVALKGNP